MGSKELRPLINFMNNLHGCNIVGDKAYRGHKKLLCLYQAKIQIS